MEMIYTVSFLIPVQCSGFTKLHPLQLSKINGKQHKEFGTRPPLNSSFSSSSSSSLETGRIDYTKKLFRTENTEVTEEPTLINQMAQTFQLE